MSYKYASINGTREDLHALVAAPVVAFDIEGSGTNIGTSVAYGYSITNNPSYAYYTDLTEDLFRIVLANEETLKIVHNAPYDRSMLKKAGTTVDNLCDTMIAAHLLGNDRLSLKALALKYLDLDIISYKELGKSLGVLSMDELLRYSGPHSMTALMLWEVLEWELRKLKLLDVFWNIEMPLVPVLSDMELNGVGVSKDALSVLGQEFDVKISTIVEALGHWSGHPNMNHNSPTQVGKLLYRELGLPTGRTTTKGGKPSVDKRYLETIIDKHPYIRPYLLFKQYKTLKDSYVDSLTKEIVDGRVYGSFNQTRTRTSRLSSSDPNLQKIPQRTSIGKRIRTAFVAPSGYVLLKADYDLLELKMMAHCSQARALIDAFLAGRDIHEETAIRVFGSEKERPKGKTLDFQMIYGGGDPQLRQKFFEAYPGVLEWTKDTIRYATEAGYVRTLGGRIRVIPELWSSRSKVRERGGREAISTIVQGSSAEIVKVGMRRLWEALRGSDVKMVLQVHDEVVLEVPVHDVLDVIEVVEDTLPCDKLSIPLTVSISIGDNWGEMKEVKSGRRR